MMSDSIRGVIPDFDEETVKKFEDSFVVSALEIVSGNDTNAIVGNTVGVSFDGDTGVKLDIRVTMSEAFDLLQRHNGGGVACGNLYMQLGDHEICKTGPFKVLSLKAMDFNHQEKMCILGIDLTKV